MSGKYILNKKHEERRICMDKSASNHNQENYTKELVSNHCCETSHRETSASKIRTCTEMMHILIIVFLKIDAYFANVPEIRWIYIRVYVIMQCPWGRCLLSGDNTH